jgi:transposase
VLFVFDRFHVVTLMNEKLTDLRREPFDKATDALHRQVLKMRWLLMVSDMPDSPQGVG